MQPRHGITIKKRTACGNMYIIINKNAAGKICQTFVHLGKAGGCLESYGHAMGRLITLALHYGAPQEEVVKQLSGINCPVSGQGQDTDIKSCPDAIAQAITEALTQSQEA